MLVTRTTFFDNIMLQPFFTRSILVADSSRVSFLLGMLISNTTVLHNSRDWHNNEGISFNFGPQIWEMWRDRHGPLVADEWSPYSFAGGPFTCTVFEVLDDGKQSDLDKPAVIRQITPTVVPLPKLRPFVACPALAARLQGLRLDLDRNG